MLERLNRRERMRLMKFVCSFAWADLEVCPEERAFIQEMVTRLTLDDEEREQVRGWLEVPPEPESVDPTLVPAEHRRVFLESVQGIIAADGRIAPEESENFRIFQDLVA